MDRGSVEGIHGMLTATSLMSGKVIHVEVMSKFCQCKEKLQDKHEDSCEANFSGSSGAMEVTGAISIFKRSKDKYAVRISRGWG